MPDRRAHRGAHPQDLELFGPDQIPALREAVHDLSWLLSRGYAVVSSLKLVGDRYRLISRQRLAVWRCACSDQALKERRQRQLPRSFPIGRPLAIDGYNVLTTIEAALAGGILIAGRDGCLRDMASMHGSWRKVMETRPALELLGRFLNEQQTGPVRWLLDQPVSNSGRLKALMQDVAAEQRWPWTVELSPNPDAALIAQSETIATSDSVVLDRCQSWWNLAQHLVVEQIPGARLVQLGE